MNRIAARVRRPIVVSTTVPAAVSIAPLNVEMTTGLQKLRTRDAESIVRGARWRLIVQCGAVSCGLVLSYLLLSPSPLSFMGATGAGMERTADAILQDTTQHLTAYAVWTGIGTVGTALLGIFLFSEPFEAMRLGCILLIVVGIVGLRLLG